MISLSEVEEYFPDGRFATFISGDIIILNKLKAVVPGGQLFDAKELYRMLVKAGINHELVANKLPRLTIFGGSGSGGIKLIFVMNRLWINGAVRKFARGVYKRSGRLYGVHWLVSDGERVQ